MAQPIMRWQPDDELTGSVMRRAGEPYEFTGGPDAGAEGLLEYWRLLRRHKIALLLPAFLGALAGFLASFLQTQTYQARASLEVQSFNEGFLGINKVDPTSVNYEADSYMQTQLKMLQSDSLLDRVVTKLRSRGPGGDERARASSVRKLLRLPQEDARTRWNEGLEGAARTLKVRGSGMTRLVEVYCESTDPQVAADFVNTLASEFIQQSLEVRWNSAQHVTQFLTNQLQGLKTQLEASEARLNVYSQSTGLLVSEKLNATEARLTDLQHELFRAQVDRIAKQSRYELASASPPESLPEVLGDATLRDYQIKLADLQRQLAELNSAYFAAHPQVKRVQAQINEVKATLQGQRANILSSIRNEYEAARRREKMLESDYSAQVRAASEQGSKAIQYNSLKREVDSTRQLYEGMLQKVKEAGVTAAMRVSNIRIVDSAKRPLFPHRPDRRLNLALGMCGGLFLGIGYVFVMRGRTPAGLKNPGEVKVHLKVPQLGLIPAANSDPSIAAGKRSLVLRRRAGAAESMDLVTWRSKFSLIAESYRSALASLLLSANEESGNRLQVIVFTSAGPREGKSTTVSNIGIAAAEVLSDTNERVLLIDGDLRTPRLHKIFGVPDDAPGLWDLLSDARPLTDLALDLFIHETKIPGLYLMPGGTGQDRTSKSLYSPHLKALLRRLRGTFSAVLIDTPPAIVFSDARILARSADAVVFVVRSGHTDLDAAVIAGQQFHEDRTPILGTILTDWDARTAGSAQGYNKHYFDAYTKYYKKPQE